MGSDSKDLEVRGSDSKGSEPDIRGRKIAASDYEGLEKLVGELSKKSPDINLVRNQMERLGLRHSTNIVECMNEVLQALQHPHGGKIAKQGQHETSV